MALHASPLFTREWDDEASFVPDRESIYLYAPATEDRGAIDFRQPRWGDVSCLEVTASQEWNIRVQGQGLDVTVPLRSSKPQDMLRQQKSKGMLYIDITSMPHSHWAPLVSAALLVAPKKLRVVYSEPKSYTRATFPTEGDIYDLSERTEGIKALPGFHRISNIEESNTWFVPLLGFEGPRFARVYEESVQPARKRVVPVIGVPGFQPNFPMATFLGNRPTLLKDRNWHAVEYAKANCPFSVFYLLDQIKIRHAPSVMKIAPIGTKPHALGAILFAIRNPATVDIVYDYPVRKAGRTTGKARVLEYYVGDFWS